jgi:hypothetical protein
MLNSRNPIGKGSKKPLRPCDREKWQAAFSSIAEYLLKLKTNAPQPRLLSQTKRKTVAIDTPGGKRNLKMKIKAQQITLITN